MHLFVLDAAQEALGALNRLAGKQCQVGSYNLKLWTRGASRVTDEAGQGKESGVPFED